MTRPRWFPPIPENLDAETQRDIWLCQGGGSPWDREMCRKPAECIWERACYFVAAVDAHDARVAAAQPAVQPVDRKAA